MFFLIFIWAFLLNLFLDKIILSGIEPKIRWFFLHAVQNLITVCLISNELYDAFIDPIEVYNKPTNFHGYAVAVSLHLYHSVFFSLNSSDRFHHLLFILFGVSYTMYFQPYIVSSLPLLSLHGIPGAIDYICLILVYYQSMDQQRHKYINMMMNTWFRAPYSVFVCGLAFPSLLKYSRYECFPCAILVLFNGIYYGNAVSESYYRLIFRDHKKNESP